MLTVLEKTLRMLYDAQKRPMSPNPGEQMSFTPPPCDPETLDPRQQTLRKFFQPVPAPSSSMDVSGVVEDYNKSDDNNGPSGQFNTVQGRDSEYSHSGSTTPRSAGSDMSMNMNINMNTNNTGFMTQFKWGTGVAWA